MPGINYLAGSIYHMVHFSNLQSIFQRRALLSKEGVIQEEIDYQSIAFEEVQNLRDRIFVWDFSKKAFRSLHSYVPFYFATHTPMLFVQYKNGIQNEVVIFEVNRSILKDQGVLFTDGNASNQQLSKYTKEVVEIVPATPMRNTCRRRYRPNGPNGANTNRTDFYSDVAFLVTLLLKAVLKDAFLLLHINQAYSSNQEENYLQGEPARLRRRRSIEMQPNSCC